jgi:hypothetical protein
MKNEIKQKAKELIIKFQHPPSALEHEECECLHIDVAKECALIAVDELIFNTFDSQHRFWIEVKQEINKH